MRRYWPEILVFGVVFAILMICLNPDYTFINKAADSIGYAYSAQYLYPSYHTSPPLYLLVSHLFLKLPFGTDAWRMGLFSVLSTMGACVFIYLIIRNLLVDKRYARWYALLGVLMYGTSALVISQSTIIQTYPLVCMLAAGAYYFAITKRWKLMGLMIGAGLAVHLLMGFVFFIMLVGFREYRRNWKALLITLSFGVFYLYIPLTNREPYMWLPAPEQVNSVWAFIQDTYSTIRWLIGGLAVWDLPKRVFDTLGIMLVSMGVIAIVPLVVYFRNNKIWRNPLFWLMLVPVLIFITELDMNTYDYTMLAVPFIVIASCVGLNIMVSKYRRIGARFALATVGIIVAFAGFNADYFDIGRTLDKDLSASNLYYNEFAKIPDGAIFMPNYAWEWEAIYKYNKDYEKNIYPICIDILPSELYREQLRQDGILLVDSDRSPSFASKDMAKSIVALNDNVWTTVSTDPSTFGSVVVEAKHNEALIATMNEAEAEAMAANPPILWKPYNPYDIITTSIMVTEWNMVLMSNWNMMFFLGLGSGGFLLYWVAVILPQRRKEEEAGDYEDTIYPKEKRG